MANTKRTKITLSKRPRPPGGTTTISASVATPLAERLDAFVRRTHWQQSRIIANALDLYTQLSPVALQRMAELGDRLGEERLREAVAHAIEQVIDRLEWNAVAEETALELKGRLSVQLSEEELVRHAEQAIAASRAVRRARREPEREVGAGGRVGGGRQSRRQR